MAKKSGSLIYIFSNIDMRCSHDGLFQILKKEKVKLKEGEYVVFLNTKRNLLKMFCGSTEVLLHYKKDNRPIDPGLIPYLPRYLGGGKIDIDGAMKEHLEDMLGRRRK